ncbi:hypothetical protein HanRHA438_Chr00c28g0854511 [Helianthus annuus]|nr:hypothetical protein HanRHA438_Chr00c28g0854511 [Helianthus annuus]
MLSFPSNGSLSSSLSFPRSSVLEMFFTSSIVDATASISTFTALNLLRTSVWLADDGSLVTPTWLPCSAWFLACQ